MDEVNVMLVTFIIRVVNIKAFSGELKQVTRVYHALSDIMHSHFPLEKASE